MRHPTTITHDQFVDAFETLPLRDRHYLLLRFVAELPTQEAKREAGTYGPPLDHEDALLAKLAHQLNIAPVDVPTLIAADFGSGAGTVPQPAVNTPPADNPPEGATGGTTAETAARHKTTYPTAGQDKEHDVPHLELIEEDGLQRASRPNPDNGSGEGARVYAMPHAVERRRPWRAVVAGVAATVLVVVAVQANSGRDDNGKTAVATAATVEPGGLDRAWSQGIHLLGAPAVVEAQPASTPWPDDLPGRWAPDRPTYTNTEYPTTPVFNSLDVDGDDGYGDERIFYTAYPSTVVDGVAQSMLEVSPGERITAQIWIHNNPSEGENGENLDGPGVAHGTRTRVLVPTGTAHQLRSRAQISAGDATPETVQSSIDFYAAEPIRLRVVPGSAKLITEPVPEGIPLPDTLFTEDTLIGQEELDGVWPADYPYAGRLTFELEVGSADAFFPPLAGGDPRGFGEYPTEPWIYGRAAPSGATGDAGSEWPLMLGGLVAARVEGSRPADDGAQSESEGDPWEMTELFFPRSESEILVRPGDVVEIAIAVDGPGIVSERLPTLGWIYTVARGWLALNDPGESKVPWVSDAVTLRAEDGEAEDPATWIWADYIEDSAVWIPAGGSRSDGVRVSDELVTPAGVEVQGLGYVVIRADIQAGYDPESSEGPMTTAGP